ncbi:MAG: aldose 1-epimerase family protein [Chitinophagaceae bacterium]|nr:aldose 1-epimerase family protein [Chitinophagaceae bacterium]
MAVIENDQLKVTIDPKGAELTSLYHKKFDLEYLWNADPEIWAKHSPVLFPIVGTLKDNTYFHEEDRFEMGRHGFAREKDFVEEEKSATAVSFLLTSSDETKKIYPFDFEFRIQYELRKSQLNVTYEITNTDSDDLLFSVGGHPAFKLPLVAGTEYADYYLEFEKEESAERWPITSEGLIEIGSTPFLQNTRILPLKKELFQLDAIVFKELESTEVSIKSSKTPRGILFDFADFPYLGIWAVKGADFVCIEPWCGIADSVDTNQQLGDKEGINLLGPQEIFTRTWSVECK